MVPRSPLQRFSVGPQQICGVIVAFCIVCGVLSVVAPPRLAYAQTQGQEFASLTEALEFSDNAWVFGDYGQVVEALAPWLLPSPPPAETGILVRGYARLGSSAFYHDQPDIARDAFLQLLLISPSYRLDPLVYPAQVIALFEEVRDQNQDRLGTIAPTIPPGAEAVFVERTVTHQSIWVSMLPFGYGFLSSDQAGVGAAYLLAQSAMAATSVGFFLSLELNRDDEGRLLNNDLNRRRRRAQLSTGWAFVGLVALNALHGALVHQDEVQVQFRQLPGPPEEFQPTSSSTIAPWSFTWTAYPIVGAEPPAF